MMRHEIDIKDAPELLQNAVQKYLDVYNKSRLLTVMTGELSSQEDESHKVKIFTAFLEWGSLFTILEAPDYLNYEVHENHITVRDLKVLIEKSEWFK